MLDTIMRLRSDACRVAVATFTVTVSVTGAPSAAAQVAGRPTEQPNAAERIVPFIIKVPDAAIADLKRRLSTPRIPEPLQGDGWALGTDARYLRDLVTYWRSRFDWRAQERRLNNFEQFTTTIDGLKIHFVHRRSKQPNAFPLLITHGWPGSFVEFTKIVGPLTDPASYGGRTEDAFDVVIPSIPGFAFSEPPREAGFDPTRIAQIEPKLMARLGYTRYGAQGAIGDRSLAKRSRAWTLRT